MSSISLAFSRVLFPLSVVHEKSQAQTSSGFVSSLRCYDAQCRLFLSCASLFSHCPHRMYRMSRWEERKTQVGVESDSKRVRVLKG